MNKKIKRIYVNNIFQNTVNSIIKEFETCVYKIWCLQRQIDIEFSKSQKFNGKQFITLCLLKLLNKVKFENKFHELCNNARDQIRSLLDR